MKVATGIFAGVVASLVGAGAASAQIDLCEESTGDVCTVEVEAIPLNPPPSAPEIQSVDPIRVQGSQQLPVTGTEAGTLALGGAVLLAAGGALVWRSRASAPTA